MKESASWFLAFMLLMIAIVLLIPCRFDPAIRLKEFNERRRLRAMKELRIKKVCTSPDCACDFQPGSCRAVDPEAIYKHWNRPRPRADDFAGLACPAECCDDPNKCGLRDACAERAKREHGWN